MFRVLYMVVGCSGDDKPSDNNASKDNNNSVEDNGNNNGDEAESALEPMTEEDITLTYASWAHGELNKYLADKFMEKYPNITVELVELEQDGWNDHIMNLASTGELPDVFWYLGNVDIAVRNAWLGDFTEYFDNDPESDTILRSEERRV